MTLSGDSWLLQVSSEWGQSSPQETGAAGHGSAPETLAVQTPWQPLPHQDWEGPASSGFTDDTSTGKTSKRQWWRNDGGELLVAWSLSQVLSHNMWHLYRFPTGLQMHGGGWRTQWDSRTWAGPWGSNFIINTSREMLNGWACAAMTLTRMVRTVFLYTQQKLKEIFLSKTLS